MSEPERNIWNLNVPKEQKKLKLEIQGFDTVIQCVKYNQVEDVRNEDLILLYITNPGFVFGFDAGRG